MLAGEFIGIRNRVAQEYAGWNGSVYSTTDGDCPVAYVVRSTGPMAHGPKPPD